MQWSNYLSNKSKKLWLFVYFRNKFFTSSFVILQNQKNNFIVSTFWILTRVWKTIWNIIIRLSFNLCFSRYPYLLVFSAVNHWPEKIRSIFFRFFLVNYFIPDPDTLVLDLTGPGYIFLRSIRKKNKVSFKAKQSKLYLFLMSYACFRQTISCLFSGFA